MSDKKSCFIKKLYTSSAHDFKGHHGKPRSENEVSDCESVKCVEGKGLVGDRYFGYKEDFKGQVTFFDWAVYEALCEQFSLPNLKPSEARRNILVSGLDLNALIGKEFSIGGVRFSGSEESAPCYWMDDAIAPGAEAFLKGRGGLRARILSSGELTLGKCEYVVSE